MREITQKALSYNHFNNKTTKGRNILLFLLVILIPTQLGKHFWPPLSFIEGLRIDYLSPTLYLTDILIISIAILSISKKSLKNTIHQKKVPFIILPLIILVIMGIFLSPRPLLGFYLLAKIIEYIFFSIVIANFFYQQTKMFLTALTISILYESFLAILQYVNNGSLNGIWYFLGERSFSQVTPGIANASINGELILRPYATFSHPNVLAGFLCIAMTILLFALIAKKDHANSKKNIGLTKEAKEEKTHFFSMKQKFSSHIGNILMIGGIVIGSIAIMLSLSRSAIIIWFLTLLVTLLTNAWYNFKHNKILRLSLLLPILAIVLGFIIDSKVYDRFFQSSFADESFKQREVLINASLNLIKTHPINGVGLNNFLPALASLPSVSSQVTLLQPVHNIFILVLTEVGVPAFCILLYLLYVVYKNLFSYKRRIAGNSFPPILQFALQITLLTQLLFLGMVDHYLLTLQQGQLLSALVFGLAIKKAKT